MTVFDQGWMLRIISWINGTAQLTTGALASPTGSDTNVVTGTAGSANDQAIWDANGDVIGLPVAAFSAYHNTTQNTGNGADAAMSFNTEEYDHGSNFASSAFTAPVNGIYHFDALFRVNAAYSTLRITLYVDTGGGYAEVRRFNMYAGTTAGQSAAISADLSLSSGDKVKVYSQANSALAIGPDATGNYFSGHLIRKT